MKTAAASKRPTNRKAKKTLRQRRNEVAKTRREAIQVVMSGREPDSVKALARAVRASETLAALDGVPGAKRRR
jgi:hypothetical protein